MKNNEGYKDRDSNSKMKDNEGERLLYNSNIDIVYYFDYCIIYQSYIHNY